MRSVTRLAIVGYPALGELDRRWIESVRARHDPQASRISAHFTLVFPVELATEPVVAHASAILAGGRPIAFVLRGAEPHPDPLGGGGHVFLVPEEGRDEITALHDRLYDGVLSSHLRRDLPFVPHVTVSGSDDFGECERLARELNRASHAVQGTLRSLDLIEVGSEGIAPVKSFSLAHRSDGPSASGKEWRSPRRGRVIRDYRAQYPDPIQVRAGQLVRLGREDDEYAGWWWCMAPDGRSGWVPGDLLRRRENLADVLEDYTATELTVRQGEEVWVERSRLEWLWVRNAKGESGWIPAGCMVPE